MKTSTVEGKLDGRYSCCTGIVWCTARIHRSPQLPNSTHPGKYQDFSDRPARFYAFRFSLEYEFHRAANANSLI